MSKSVYNPANLTHKLTRLKAGEMAVQRMNGKQCCEVFKVSDIIREIEERWIPTVAKLRRQCR